MKKKILLITCLFVAITLLIVVAAVFAEVILDTTTRTGLSIHTLKIPAESAEFLFLSGVATAFGIIYDKVE